MNSKTSAIMAVDCRISIAGKQPDQVSEDCIICCEKITDKAFVNNCLHYFCCTCINQWIEVRAVCPLCVQPIVSIISNVRSADDYDLQTVEPPETDVLSSYLDADVELWPARDDDDDDDDDVDDEVFYLSHLSSDDSAPVSSSTDSESSPINDFHDAMDEDSSDISHVDGEFTFNCDTDVLSSDDEVKSHISSYSEMGDEDWQEDSTWFENYIENEIENHSVLDSEVEDEPFDFTYDNLCESDDNNSPASFNVSEYEESVGSGYDYHTDEDDYDPDFSFNDSFDNY